MSALAAGAPRKPDHSADRIEADSADRPVGPAIDLAADFADRPVGRSADRDDSVAVGSVDRLVGRFADPVVSAAGPAARPIGFADPTIDSVNSADLDSAGPVDSFDLVSADPDSVVAGSVGSADLGSVAAVAVDLAAASAAKPTPGYISRPDRSTASAARLHTAQ